MRRYKVITVKSTRDIQFIDITNEVKRYLIERRVHDGILIVYTPHTTGGITVNENADPAVTADIESFIRERIPHEKYFKHSEGNSHAHIMSSYFSPSQTFIIDEGQLVLGQWQNIYFCEFDGPRSRNIYLKIMPYPENE